jgi:general secretion pathway protein A
MKDFRSRFGFHTTPFTREISVRDLLRFDFFDEALTGLTRTVEQRMSAALIAPAGVGKTALLRALTEQLPEARYRVSYVKVTSLSKRDMCREIAAATGAPLAGSYPTLVRNLQEHYANAMAADALRPVLVLDEAHDMRPDVLAMLRVLTNFEMDSRLVTSVIVAGQPPLRELLRRDELEAVARRLAHYASLRPLSRDESVRYIEHRTAVAGATAIPFDAIAFDAIYEVARGNLRAIDRLALKAIELAHDADDAVITNRHVIEARKVLWA